ncbi:MAG: HD-GYP domain-containing protein [Thermoleophilaceae bacterium]
MLLAEQLVGEARERHARRMSRRERLVTTISGTALLALAIAAILFLPNERSADPLLGGILLVGYALASRVRFEFAGCYVSPEQLLFVPAVLLLPLPYIPAFVAIASVLSLLPQVVGGNWHRDRLVGCFADSWFCIGPVVVLALLAPGEVTLAASGVYALALLAQLGVDFAWSLTRNALLDHVPNGEFVRSFSGTARVDLILSPVALMFAVGADQQPLALLTSFPLIWLLEVFSRDRQARYESALELHRAYRGTVTLLSDVVEFDDPYTAAHSRSIVELVDATSEKLGIPQEDRQRLEFAALLHDVGKIAIPKEVLNKPASLNDEEFALMKTHTIEGQFMLDRVGGFLGQIGEIVRSCHERWDGAGYPDGLAGEKIPFAARLVFCCDAYNAMTTDRVYRAALSREAAIAELKRHAGTQFDPRIVRALVEVVEEGEPAVAGNDEIRAILAKQTLVKVDV